MKKLIFLALVIFLFAMAVPVLAQEVGTSWVSRYNGPANSDDRANDLAIDGSGNVYVTGYSVGVGTGPADYATVKYDTGGSQQWVTRLATAGPDYAVAIAVDGFGNPHVTGSAWWSVNQDYATAKYNTINGNQLWATAYLGMGSTDLARDITVDGSGNVYVTGISVNPPSGGDIDFATIKYDPNGVSLWTQRYDGQASADDSASAIAVDASGNVYVTGQTKIMNSPPAPYTMRGYAVIEYGPAGNQIWAINFGSQPNKNDYPYDIAVDGSGNAYVTGRTNGTGFDYMTIKIASNGTPQWTKMYNGPGNSNDEARAIAVDASGNVYVTGYSFGSGTNEDYATIKYRPNGDTAWVRRYDNPEHNHDFANAIAIDNAGNVYVTGQSYTASTGWDYATVKYDSSGNQKWVKTYNGPAGINDVALSIAVNSSGNVYVTGYSDGGGTSYDYATMMLWQDYAPVVAAVDSTKFLCFPDTIKLTVVATDSDAVDTLTLSGPGIPVPVKGVSPLSVEAKIYVGSSGTYNYVYTVSDRWLTDSDTATYQVTINTAPIVAAPDSSKIFCGPDTIRFRVTATDPNVGDTLTLSGPGIPTPIKGLSPLSANIKIYISATGTYSYIYNVTDKCGAIDDDTATYAVTINTLPGAFSLLTPVDSSLFVPFLTANFNWADAVDPDTGTSLKYTLYVSTSLNFHPDSTAIHSNLSVSQYNDTLMNPARYWWKAKVSDNCGSVWSTQTWTLLAAKRGDANGDKALTVSDVVYIINYLFKGGPLPIPEQIVGDASCDGKVTVSDVVYLINYLFKGGPPPC